MSALSRVRPDEFTIAMLATVMPDFNSALEKVE